MPGKLNIPADSVPPLAQTEPAATSSHHARSRYCGQAFGLIVLALYGVLPRTLSAQMGAISGRVLADKTERPIPNARVELRSRGVATRSDSIGRFRIDAVSPGDYVIVILAIGYDSLLATVRLAPSDVVDADFLLTRPAQTLAPVKVAADRTIEGMRLAEFDGRRAMGFGRFIDRAVFATNTASQVDVVVIGRVPGLRTHRVAGKTVFAAQRDAKLCYPQVIVNGFSLWNGVPSSPSNPRDAKIARETQMFDVNTLRTDEIIGFEWHNPSTTPLRYNATGAGGDGSACGTAIFWTK